MALFLDCVGYGMRVATQGGFRVDARLAAGGGEFKKFFARGFFIQALGLGGNGRAVHHPFSGQALLFNLFEYFARVEQRRELGGQALEQSFRRGAVFLFRGLDFVPLVKHGLGVRQIHVAKHMRVTPDELFVYLPRHVVKIKMPGLRCHLRVHDDVEQQIPEFLAHMGEIAPVNRIQ